MATREKFIAHKIKAAEHARLSGGNPPTRSVMGTGSPNRHGLPTLPTGQREVTNWPVLDLGIQPDIPLENWRLEIKGEVDVPTEFDWAAFTALPRRDDVSDFHCVTTWSRMNNHWRGVSFKTIADSVRPKPSARFLYITGYDGYSTNLRLEEALDPDVLLVHHWEGEPLTRAHGGPVRMIVPRKYAWKGAKWIREIFFLAEEEKGFRELRGYSNTAEPWYNDRYSH